MTARVRTPARFAAECVKRDTWHRAGEHCDSPKCPPAPDGENGWVIHDYWEYQPSKEQVLSDRKKSAERQAKWKAARAGKPPKPDADTHKSESNGSSNGVTNAVINASPPRPAPKEAGRAEPAPSGPPDGRAIPSGSPSGGRQDSKSVAEAHAVGVNGHARHSPDAYERGPELARKLMAERRKPP